MPPARALDPLVASGLQKVRPALHGCLMAAHGLRDSPARAGVPWLPSNAPRRHRYAQKEAPTRGWPRLGVGNDEVWGVAQTTRC
jgi:hypothetical protein